MHTTTTAETGGDEVQSWRRDQLCASGFRPALAAEIAGDARYDLHAVIELVDHGCPPHLAARILGPLE